MGKKLFARILGNDIMTLHGVNQTLENLKFTTKHESDFVETDKTYILNRIADRRKKELIIEHLNQNNIYYLDLPFEFHEFSKLPYLDFRTPPDRINQNSLLKMLVPYNLYLCNVNSCRNHIIEYGVENEYEFILPFDSNSFFSKSMFDNLFSSLSKETKYLVVPQLRIAEKGLRNEEILNQEIDLQMFHKREPQIVFRGDSVHRYEERIPYGIGCKAEFLNALKVTGEWNGWLAQKRIGLEQRIFQDSKFEIRSGVFRLNPGNKSNEINSNYNNRIIGLWNMVHSISKKYK